MKYTIVSLFLLLTFYCQPRHKYKMLHQFGSHEWDYAIQQPIPIIPLPQEMTLGEGHFELNKQTKWVIDPEVSDMRVLTKLFNETIQQARGFELAVDTDKNASNRIVLSVDSASKMNPEGYELKVSKEQISIHASHAAGLFYGWQTLRQLLPVEFEQSSQMDSTSWVIPCVEIKDEPRFSYRGMHLDVARHFFSVDEVKRYLDAMAMHKFNTFHWHLTEDQGWRIEIKQYPKLTEIGAFRKETLIGHANDAPEKFDGKRYGGYYTQEDIKEVVAYAKERFIEVIPEIEMPGHSQAALAAYPELACTEGPFEVATKWGIFEEVYCPTETTFTFLENVLTEVIELFPSTYIHIGGDECPKIRWKKSAFCQQLMKEQGLKNEQELQSYFIKRIEAFLNKNQKQLIGWDEILEGGLSPNATVMSWRGTKGGIEAAEQGHDVIMTPTSHCYFDYYQSDGKEEPLAIGGYTPLKKVYHFEPIPKELDKEAHKHILGAQCNLWTEYIPTIDHLFYMAYPRASALSEVLWSDPAQRDYNSFLSRLNTHLIRLQNNEINTANHIYEIKLSTNQAPNNKGVQVALHTESDAPALHMTLDGTDPNMMSNTYTYPFTVYENATLKMAPFIESKQVGDIQEVKMYIHKAAGRAIELTTPPHEKYSFGGKQALVNGILGNQNRYGDAEWLGWWGEDFEAVIDLGSVQKLKYIHLFFFNGPTQWIYLPSKIEYWLSTDGENYKLEGTITDISSTTKVAFIENLLDYEEAQYVKIKATNFGKIPEGKQGAGYDAWLFVDEIIIE